MHNSFRKCKGYFSLTRRYFKYKKKFTKLKINKPKDCLKVGIIGELYTRLGILNEEKSGPLGAAKALVKFIK